MKQKIYTILFVAVIALASSPELSAAPKGMAALPIKLPKPMFVGTPANLKNIPNLEAARGKPRPPFYAPVGCKNLAAKKPISGSDEEPIMGEMEMLTDVFIQSLYQAYALKETALLNCSLQFASAFYFFAHRHQHSFLIALLDIGATSTLSSILYNISAGNGV